MFQLNHVMELFIWLGKLCKEQGFFTCFLKLNNCCCFLSEGGGSRKECAGQFRPSFIFWEVLEAEFNSQGHFLDGVMLPTENDCVKDCSILTNSNF